MIDLTKEENEISYQEGIQILDYLMKKYSNETIRDLDIVLNSLCCALIRLIYLNVSKKNYEEFSELIKKILLKNLET